jgi:uncharacterized protein (DUF1778 family)
MPTKLQRHPLAIRLSDDEREAIEIAAKHRQESLSEFLRNAGKEKARSILREINKKKREN